VRICERRRERDVRPPSAGSSVPLRVLASRATFLTRASASLCRDGRVVHVDWQKQVYGMRFGKNLEPDDIRRRSGTKK
jgi:hypothetical protein